MSLKEHLQFTFEMLTLTGIVSLLAAIYILFFTEDSNLSYLALMFIFYSWLLYNMNWKFDNLKDDLNKIKNATIKK